jgi:hypothetical protein
MNTESKTDKPIHEWAMDALQQAAKNMEAGGSFAAYIGKAYLCADATNARILRTSFESLFRRFGGPSN